MSNDELIGQIEAFLEEAKYEPNTHATYQRALLTLAEFLERAYGVRSLAVADDTYLGAFYAWLRAPRGKDYSPRTAATYVAGAKRFSIWLVTSGRMPKHLTLATILAHLESIRGRRSEEARELRKVDEGIPLAVLYYDTLELPAGDSPKAIRERLLLLRARALMHVLYSTGARIGEVLSLTCKAVEDGKAKQATIRTKRNREHIIFLDEEARAAISAYVNERRRLGDRSRWLFVGHRGAAKGRQVSRMTRSTGWAIVKRAARAVGLDESTSPHSIRHYRARQLLEAGMPLENVQQFLGHKLIATTRKVYAPEISAAALATQLHRFSVSASAAAEASARRKQQEGEGQEEETA